MLREIGYRLGPEFLNVLQPPTGLLIVHLHLNLPS
jgi:hypothetical protein